MAGATDVSFLFHEQMDDGRVCMRRSDVKIGRPSVFHHPDPEVDLCGIPLAWPMSLARERLLRKPYVAGVPPEIIATEEQLASLRALEPVTMFGYPQGLWDSTHNLPLARRGMTASPPNVDFDGKPTFYVDLACFPGSSGSPVYVLDEGSYTNRAGQLVLMNRILLLGVLFRGPTARVEGVVDDVATGQRSVAHHMMHLGEVIKAREILKVRDVFLQHVETLKDQPRPRPEDAVIVPPTTP